MHIQGRYLGQQQVRGTEIHPNGRVRSLASQHPVGRLQDSCNQLYALQVKLSVPQGKMCIRGESQNSSLFEQALLKEHRQLLEKCKKCKVKYECDDGRQDCVRGAAKTQE